MLVCGCSFDASGIAESSAAGPGSGGSTAGSSGGGPGSGGVVTTGEQGSGSGGSSGGAGPETTGGPGSSGPGTTDLTTTTDPSESSTSGPDSSSGSDETTTTGAPSCPLPYKQIVKVADASVVAPMAKYMSGMGEGTVAYSADPEKGIVTFTIEPPCDGPVAVWARVQDADPGVHMMKDPDSFYPHVDNLPEAGWAYGCQTEGMDAGYHWLRVRMGNIGDECDTFVDLSPQLTAGAHTISLRNREGQSGMAVASIARLLVTADMNYVPGGGD